MFKRKFAAILSTLVLSSAVFAGQEIVCPNLSDIQAVGVTMAEELRHDVYFTYNFNAYNTDATWGFVIAPIEAESVQVALHKANALLSSMSSAGVPEKEHHEIYCGYNTGSQQIMAAAVKSDETLSLNKLKQLIAKVH